jgi:SNF2 family DNA or RNA helicase
VDEKNKLIKIAKDFTNHISVIDGATKDRSAFDEYDDSIIFIQYQSGSMGLNLQAANKIIYFTPPQSSELFEQSKKRTHRIGQERTCYYYYLICDDTVEPWIYKTLKDRRELTANLFKGVDGFDYKRLSKRAG